MCSEKRPKQIDESKNATSEVENKNASNQKTEQKQILYQICLKLKLWISLKPEDSDGIFFDINYFGNHERIGVVSYRDWVIYY